MEVNVEGNYNSEFECNTELIVNVEAEQQTQIQNSSVQNQLSSSSNHLHYHLDENLLNTPNLVYEEANVGVKNPMLTDAIKTDGALDRIEDSNIEDLNLGLDLELELDSWSPTASVYELFYENRNSYNILDNEHGYSISVPVPVPELKVSLQRLKAKRKRTPPSSPQLKQKQTKGRRTRKSRVNENIPVVGTTDDDIWTTPSLVPLDSSQFSKTIVYTDFTNDRNYLFEYDFRTQTNKMIHEVIPRKKLASLAYFNNKIYDLGGTLSASIRADECKSSTFLDIFDKGESRFAENLDHLPRMTEPKNSAAVCICQGSLYSIGGSQEDQRGPIVVNYVERLDLNQRNLDLQWEVTNSLNKERESHDVAVLDDKIFVIGGLGEGNQECLDGDLKSVELYDPGWEVGDPDCDWEQLPDMHERRPYVKVAVLNDKIYAVGGDAYVKSIGGRQSLYSVEVFNPERSTWAKCCRMKHRRSSGILMVENNLLYAIGGNSRIRPSMEVYDPRIDQWMNFPWPIGLGTHDSEYAFGIVINKEDI